MKCKVRLGKIFLVGMVMVGTIVMVGLNDMAWMGWILFIM